MAIEIGEIGDWLGTGGRRLAVLVLAVMLITGVSVAAVVVSLSYTPVSGATGTLGTADVQTDSSSLQYSGIDVIAVDITITNTDSGSAHDADVVVTVDTASGTTTHTKTVSGLGASSTTTLTVDITDVRMDNFNGIDVRIEQTA